MTTPTQRRHGRAADIGLTVGAVIGVVCVLSALIAIVAGVRPVVFETGSMAPTIPTGSLGIAKSVPATELRPGDVVGVVRDDGVRVTHRVVSVDGVAGDSVTLTMRGDDNPAPDHAPYVVTTGDRIVGSVPVAGYIAVWLSNPYTVALQALAAVFLLAIAFAPKRGWRTSTAAQRLIAGTAAATVVVVAVSGLHASGDALAADRPDQANAVGSLTAVAVNAPTYLTCANTGTPLLNPSATLTWPVAEEQKGIFTYEVISGTTSLGTVSATNNGTATFTIGSGILGGLLNSLLGTSFAVQVVAKVGNWTSAPSASQTITYPLFALGPSCKTQGQANTTSTATKSTLNKGVPSAEPSSTEPSSTESPSASPSTTPSSEPPSTSATPELPEGGTRSASASYAFYQDSSQVTIRDSASTEIVYRGDFPSGSDVQWLPGTDDLEVTAPDGTVTVVSVEGGEWTTRVTPPPTSETPTPDNSGPETVEPDAVQPTDDAATE